MTKNINPLRPGLTAIAAVLAMSSTAAFAQAVDTSANAPATITPPAAPPATQASAPTLDLAPPAAASTMAPADPVASSAPASMNSDGAASPAPAPMATASHPVIHTEPAADSASTADASVPKAAKIAHVRANAKVAAADSASTKAPVTPALETAPTPPTPVAGTLSPSTAAPLPAEPTVTPAATPAPAPVASVSRGDVSDDTLEIAGIGGIAVLALAGGAFALYRRKRDDEEEVYETAPVEMEPAPVVAPAVAATAMPSVAPVAVRGESKLPAGFDVSRFGPRVQAAYRGPTADNPSLSLKTRLKRAHFYDMRERRAAEVSQPAAATPQAAPVSAPVRNDEQIVYRAGRVSKGGFKPTFQRLSS
jgi:hypothetical protein